MQTIHKQRCPLWIRRLFPGLVAVMLPFLLIMLLVSTAVALPTQALPTPPGVIVADLGDAPVTNMTAYTQPTTITASFPTIYVPGMQSGPFHRFPKEGPYLGDGVSEEANAHLGIDEDIETNIHPPTDRANMDKEDSEITIISLKACEPSFITLDITVPVGGERSMFLNLWLDFSRNGDLNDTASTMCGTLSEWAIQNRPIELQTSQTVTLMVMPYHLNGLDQEDLWMRVTLSDTEAPLADNGLADGSGPAAGYMYGETEDYLLKYEDECCARAGWQG